VWVTGLAPLLFVRLRLAQPVGYGGDQAATPPHAPRA
jgi:hypothetical protein